MADKSLTYRQAKAMWRLGGSKRSAEVIAILFGPKVDPRAAGVEAYRAALTGTGPLVDGPAPRFA